MDLTGGTHRLDFIKKYKIENKPYSLKELAQISGEPLATLKKVADRGYGAYNTQPSSVRMKGTFKKGVNAPMSMKLSPQQWSMARVYSYLMKNPKHDNDLRGGVNDAKLIFFANYAGQQPYMVRRQRGEEGVPQRPLPGDLQLAPRSVSPPTVTHFVQAPASSAPDSPAGRRGVSAVLPPNLQKGSYLGRGADNKWIQGVVAHMKTGAFKAQADRVGKSTKQYAKEVLAHPEKHTLKTRRRAQFVENIS